MKDMGTSKSTLAAPSNGEVAPSKFTPGPWVVSKDRHALLDGEHVIIGADDWHVATTCQSATFHGLDDQTESDGNARLIAAAPDMLAVCQSIVAASQSGHDTVGLLLDLHVITMRARAVIAKALGQNSDDRVQDGDNGAGA